LEAVGCCLWLQEHDGSRGEKESVSTIAPMVYQVTRLDHESVSVCIRLGYKPFTTLTTTSSCRTSFRQFPETEVINSTLTFACDRLATRLKSLSNRALPCLRPYASTCFHLARTQCLLQHACGVSYVSSCSVKDICPWYQVVRGSAPSPPSPLSIMILYTLARETERSIITATSILEARSLARKGGSRGKSRNR